MTKLHILFSLIALMLCGNIAAQGTGTQDDPIAVSNLADVKNVDDAGKWFLIDLAGKQVTFKASNDVLIEDETAGLLFTNTSVKDMVTAGDKITSGKIKLVCEKHNKSVQVNGKSNNVVEVVEDIVKEAGTAVAKEAALDVTIEENWGRYIKVKGKILKVENGKGGYNYYLNEAVQANRIYPNYCKSTIDEVAGNDKEYYVYGALISDGFRAATFEKVSLGLGTEEDPFVVKNLIDVKSTTDAGKWFLVDLAGKQVTFKQGNEVCIEDETAGLIFTKGSMKNLVNMGDHLISGRIKFVCETHGKSVWVNGANNDVVVAENITKEDGTAVAKEVTIDGYAENWGRYVKVKGKIVSESNGKGGFNYYFNTAGNRANRIATNYCGNTIPYIADNQKTYYVSGLLLSDYFRAASFEEIPSVKVSDKKYTTWVTTCAVDFGNEVKAYIATDVTEDKVKTLQINNAPAETPVIIYAENKGEYFFNKIETEDVTDIDKAERNKLLASDGTITGGDKIYALAVKNNVAGFYRMASTVSIPAGKEWENAPINNAREFIPMDGETTGIANIAGENTNGKKVYHNLSGMRVDNPQKGIYVVNGKKVIF